jgi:TonB family protein
MPLEARPGKMSPAALAASAMLHASMALLIFSMTFPEAARLPQLFVTPLYAPETARPKAMSPPAPTGPAPRLPPPVPIPEARVRAPSMTLPNPPEPAPAIVPEPFRPPVVLPPDTPPPPVQPPDPVKTAGFGAVSRAETAPRRSPPTPAAGFGAAVAPLPNRPLNAALVRIGSLEGPRTEASALPGHVPVVSAGFGTPSPGDPPFPSAGSTPFTGAFGDGTLSPAVAATSARLGPSAAVAFGSVDRAQVKPVAQPPVAKSPFETAVAAPAGAAKRPQASDDRSAALEILDKPRPAYSDEALRLQIEGEVVLEILFTASGQIRVLRVLHGLGHGLEESALKAAMAIRFRPALEHGIPIDTVATARIEFQLAY